MQTPSSDIASLCVRRPVLAIVLSLLIVVAGAAAILGVEVRELPNVDRPVITVRTDYAGAAPETMDVQVTSVVEGAAARVPGATSISSSSSYGESRVRIQFDPSIDLQAAANDVRDAVARIAGRLPEDAEDPIVVKADADAQAVMRLAVTSATRPIEDLTDLVEEQVVDRIAAVGGVADVQTYGLRQQVIRVVVDPVALASRGISATDVRDALRDAASDAPAGTLSTRNQELILRADARVTSAEEVARLAIGPTTRLSDIATVISGPAVPQSSIRFDGRNGVGLGIIRQAQSNTLSISADVRAAVATLERTLPDDVRIVVTSDDATFIEGSVREVALTLLLSTAIVVAIIFAFLRSWRTTLIPAVTVPVALIGTVAAIWLAGFSINILTLLALVLATGMVVDDAIVVLENIERRRAEGIGPRAAAVLGTRQVFFAVIATTATLASVFVPISFLPGTAGRLFTEFGYVLAVAVLLSSFVALTLCPMLASRLVGGGTGGHAAGPGEPAREGVGQRLYRVLLDAALGAPLVALALAVGFAVLAAGTLRSLPQELTPAEDRGSVLIRVSAPEGVNLDYTNRQMLEIEEIVAPLLASGEAVRSFAIAGSGGSANSGFFIVTLAPWHERARSQQEIVRELTDQFSAMPGARVMIFGGNSLGIRGGGSGLQFALTGSDYGRLQQAAEELIVAMQERLPQLDSPRLGYETTQPQISVRIDRERAADLGIAVADISATLQIMMGSRDVAELRAGSDIIPILLEAPAGTVDDPGDIENLYVTTNDGRVLPLSSLVTLEEVAVASELEREAQLRAMPVTAGLADGYAMGQAVEDVRALADEVLPPDIGLLLTGEAATLEETSGSMAWTFAFAILVVLLVLAAQFESFVSAVVIVLTVPFGLAAAVLAIWLSGGSLNIYSQIGLVMLVGLMAKNGILIVEFANQLRDEGYRVHDAIREAALVRLRPVLMTMISTVLGGLPLVLASGAGAEAREALGWIVVGGLGISTLFTLFLTPVAFLLLAGLSKPRAAEERRLDRELGEAEGRPRIANDPPDGPRAAAAE
ncbi:efflux RND transporter permease subunit [Arenibaculum sp.]|uniref:efflux RND transporter permease subunit n=1 Tax=Arenibaculum sp. TaxID=2865862 RepID=UPI002E0F5AF3|nr:efflux RND transporter permease subunit [Arenibaculum sp.]